ncbi:MAG: cupredoxin domain-containing protein [Chloroflexota bacterium]|nr:cupredoxin domain-containing protein [Chloroflexota bacterium]
MRLRRVLGTCVVALLLSTPGVSAAGDMSSVNIVEPRLQAKWGFAPATVKIQPGSWITWSNAGQDPHTVTALDGSFDSGNLDPSEGYSWFFADAGTFTYTCVLHPWMQGTVIVAPSAPTPPTADPVPADAQ